MTLSEARICWKYRHLVWLDGREQVVIQELIDETECSIIRPPSLWMDEAYLKDLICEYTPVSMHTRQFLEEYPDEKAKRKDR